MKIRLFYKIFGTYLAILALAMAVMHFFVGQQVKSGLEGQIERELLTHARIIDLGSRSEIESRIFQLAKISQSRVTLIDDNGRVLVDSDEEASRMDDHINRPEVQEAKVRGTGRSTRYSDTLGEEMMYVALAVRERGGISGYIRLARPLVEVRKITEAFNRILFNSFLLIIISSLFIAFLFSYKLSSPIREMEQFTDRLRRGEGPGTLIIDSSDEMGQLAKNINYLVEELRSQIKSLNEEKGKVEAALASAIEGVIILNSQDRVESMNRSMKRMIGDQYGDILNKTPIEAFRNIDLQKALDRFKATGMPVSEEIVLGAGTPIILDVNITSIPGVTAGEEKTMLVFHDVTRLKKLEQVRVDFVANVTHEIKTPLTAILGYIETLEAGAIEDKETARKFLQTISRHAQRLNRLLEDLLTLSNIELGEMKFQFEGVALGGVMEGVLNIMELKAREKKLSIEKKIPETLSLLRADRDRMTQIFLNVLDNAVKFTPEGGGVRIDASETDRDEAVVRITDTGIGVPRDEVERLGERFYRVDKTRSRELGGTGLGLSIVKHFMLAHRGRMEIESQLGRGMTVSLYFPIWRG
ncbi:MAG: ATP-binding protein [Deltaproteobacteria bacterium]|nr:ATP-binding protein [Deltaproteobacteria bacterium]